MYALNSYRYPYYIVAPRYIRTSGGVRTLFRLADRINKAGGDAFIFLWPSFNSDLAVSPMDIAPLLTKKTVDYHFQYGLTPIVIYPETVRVNRFNPPVRVRYLLNYDNLFYQNESYEDDHHLLFYSQAIAEKVSTNKSSSTLYLPVSDADFFSPPAEQSYRSGAAFYAGKYKYHFGGKLLPITEGMPEITRDKPGSQAPEQIRELFRTIEFFYCYEDSALALEAILCGCPVVFLPNEHFRAPLGANELKGNGFAWGSSVEQMRHAKETVAAAREEHLRRVEEVQGRVLEFIKETQAIATHERYQIPFAHGVLKSPGSIRKAIDFVRFLRDVVSDRGLRNSVKIVVKRLWARRLVL